MNILRHFPCLFRIGWGYTQTILDKSMSVGINDHRLLKLDTCLHCGYVFVHVIKDYRK